MSRRLADTLERAARVAAPAALALFVLIGVVLNDQPLPLAVVAGVVAVGLGLALGAGSPKVWVLVGLLAVVAADGRGLLRGPGRPRLAQPVRTGGLGRGDGARRAGLHARWGAGHGLGD